MTLSATQDGYSEREVKIRTEDGLHMRPAMQFVDCASQFDSEIKIYKDSQCVDGKSIMQITMLAATKDTELKIAATGTDAAQAVETLANLIEQEPPDSADEISASTEGVQENTE